METLRRHASQREKINAALHYIYILEYTENSICIYPALPSLAFAIPPTTLTKGTFPKVFNH